MEEIVEFSNYTIFPDGTTNFRVETPESGAVTILAQELNIVDIALTVNALRNKGYKGKINLFCPYIPARQDRICNEGEPFTVKVYAELINGLGLDKVITLEPHSDVLPALIDNVEVWGIEDVFDFDRIVEPDLNVRLVLVAPDAGAAKRTNSLAKFLKAKYPEKNISVKQASKVRNVEDGTIEKIEAPTNSNPFDQYLIVDDVCAMGGTFLGLYDEMKRNGAKNIDIVLAHVDRERNGLDALCKKFRKVYITNSQSNYQYVKKENLQVVRLFD